MITTAGSLRWDESKAFRLITYIILGLAISATLVFADDHSPVVGSPIRVTHVLGLDGVANNTAGSISIQENALRFRKGEGPTAEISVGSIVNVSLGEQDKQVGGVPMAVGRAAAPYGGGRVISLFSHKKYDILTIEYVDTNGGLHGAIFQLDKGQAQVVRNELVTDGARVVQTGDHGAKLSAAEIKNESK
jgi:hypothetical protein